MERTLYLSAFPRPVEGREADVLALWAERRALIVRWHDELTGVQSWFGRESRRRRDNEQRLAEIDAAIEEWTTPVTSAFQGPRVVLDPEADAWFAEHVFRDPGHAAELRRLVAGLASTSDPRTDEPAPAPGTEAAPPAGPLNLAACLQAFLGAPVTALEGRRSFASLLYALPYGAMEFRLTPAWAGSTFPRQRWNALQWPQDTWPRDGGLPAWIHERESGLTVPLRPPVAEQFADRFESELLRALAPLPGLRGVPTRRLRAAALHVWRHAGDPPDETQDPDADPDSAPLPPLPVETRRRLSFAADLFDQVTWIRRWAGLGYPLGLELA